MNFDSLCETRATMVFGTNNAVPRAKTNQINDTQSNHKNSPTLVDMAVCFFQWFNKQQQQPTNWLTNSIQIHQHINDNV